MPIGRASRAHALADGGVRRRLLTDDVLVTMPPVPLEYQGRELVERFFAVVAFRDGRTFRLIATRANGQPAFGIYVREPRASVLHANGLLVITSPAIGSAL
jgi:RNA polymerase sigma-70 factor (ECF subfamily)